MNGSMSSRLKQGSTNTPGSLPRPVIPIWESGTFFSDAQYEVFEVDLLSQGAQGFMTAESYEKWLTSQSHGYLGSIIRLVVRKHRETGSVDGFLMSMVADTDYLTRKDFAPWDQNSYLSKDSDFSGAVLFHDLAGNFVNGWRFERGEVTHALSLAVGPRLKSGDGCGFWEVEVWYQDCMEWRNSRGEFLDTTCGPWVVEYEVFFMCQDGGGGGYGGGGGGGPVVPDPPVPPDPCEQVAALSQNQFFKEHLQILKGKLGENYEAGYLLNRNADGSWQSRAIQGKPNALSIDFPIEQGKKYEVLMHTHPEGGLSIFSPDDLQAIYLMYQNQMTSDFKTFSFNVITAEGTTYTLKIDNVDDFLLFGAEYLKDDLGFGLLKHSYNLFVKNSNSVFQNELGFLKLMNNLGAGLNLFKGDFENLGQWNPLEVQNNQIVNRDCN